MTEIEKDKYKAVWLSHSSIGDYLKCPRLYFLRNVYKNPLSRRKFTIMNPPLALGQVVHEVIESLSFLPTNERFQYPLHKNFEVSWQKVGGEKGGFRNHEQESEYKDRGLKMLKNLEENPGPILMKALKLKSEDGLPYYWFPEEENIILCGKIDWIEYLDASNSIHIIDFKTGRNEEDDASLQLPIYLLLAKNLQKREVSKASYWYLAKPNGMTEVELPEIEDSVEKVRKIASRIKLVRQLNHFVCESNGCRYCIPFEKVVHGGGKLVGLSDYGQEIYIEK